MKITITGRNFDVNEDLKKHLYRSLENMKFINKDAEVNVVLSTEKSRQKAEISVQWKSQYYNSSEVTHDMRQSIDTVTHKIDKQAKRNKELNYTTKRAPRKDKTFTLAEELSFDDEKFALTEITDGNSGRKIIPMKHFAPKPMSIEEAAEQMDISEKEFLVFRNSKTNQVNVLYVRNDDNYGLIEPDF